MRTDRKLRSRTHCLITTSAALALMASAALASPYTDINRAAETEEIEIVPLRGGLSMLTGSGGNIAALPGPRGFLLVDTGIGLSKSKIVQALARIGPDNIQLAIISHWHWDHADGGAWIRASGADVMADITTIARLKQTIHVPEWGHTFQPTAPDALPNIAITADRTFTINGETVQIRRYRAGHTDNDISVHFAKADVLVAGDTFWNGQYPFIDHNTGGTIDGAIAAANANIAMANERTIVVPGHGPVGNRASLVAFRDMLVSIRERVATLKKRGMTLEQVQDARPTASYDARWGRSVISGALFTALVYHSA
jgi:glyoxylase-like metal-dependent hydrolase (beta-lactamase superfamily II)